MKTQAIARLQEVAADAEVTRLRKRITDINAKLEKLKGKTDKSSATQRAKLTEDLKISRAQKKKLIEKNKTSASTEKSPAQKRLDAALKKAQGYKDNDMVPPSSVEREIKAAREALKFEKNKK